MNATDYRCSPGGTKMTVEREKDEESSQLRPHKESNLSFNSGSSPVLSLAASPLSADAPKLSFPRLESDKRGGVRRGGAGSEARPIKEPHGACAEPRPAPLTGKSL
ncbi:hypothetical protein PBY51_023285 [Eleginops maclovinus]|uniref:Uncharacterized protein n=1 Tax=Eleginops maclovinus TaxID=56733 RepID=A0AAN8AE66_ELEMC|nr:hypothetical protein PBY51_023285 [Eleginops maclovinus]